MDARIHVEALLGVRAGDLHIIRNAGGIVTDDVVRSLAISQHRLGTREIAVIRHTDCGMLTLDDATFVNELEATGGARPGWEPLGFRDLDDGVRDDLATLRTCPFLVEREKVRGFVFDVATGELRGVTPGEVLGGGPLVDQRRRTPGRPVSRARRRAGFE